MIIARNRRIFLNEIIVPRFFEEHPPKPEKVDAREKRWRKTGFLQKIYVNRNNVLVDGYITYLILLRNDIESTRGVVLFNRANPKYLAPEPEPERTPQKPAQPYGFRLGRLHITFTREG